MLTVGEASRAIADAMAPFALESVALDAACGRILRQDVVAERDQPPFDRVTMDGIAIRFDAWTGGTREFAIQGTQHAGDPVQTLTDPGNCIEIMTGAMRPEGTDCIVPVERISVADGVATLADDYEPAHRQFIHPRGSDHVAGHKVIGPGQVIAPTDVAIIASCGLETVTVSRIPRVAVISTGNELIPPGSAIEPHQIRLSNGPALAAMLCAEGFTDTIEAHLLDEPAELEKSLGNMLATRDVLVLSGGVSMGKADFVPQVLAELGVDVVFHKISQRPGKPMWFGIGPDGQAVFALPGNPVSTLVCCRQYVLPALLHASGRQPTVARYAVLGEDIAFKPNLTCFMPVTVVDDENGRHIATPVPTNTSGDFASLTGTDGYVELAQETSLFAAGQAVPFHPWNQP
jgi:molybdopterin molybdotransferase